MLCIARTLLSQDVCPSVCLSITRRYFVEMAQRFIRLFSLTGSHITLVLAVSNIMAIFPRGSRNGGVECREV